ncbi:MAG: ankyrin repeat domain-containing protein [Rhodocyclaceae bacterium]|nr:ankyrin repeat domain-containing protein [Rhodocyclaceae bacterium]
MADQRKVPDSLSGIHHEGCSDDAGRNTSTPALRVIPSAFDGESFAVLPLFVFYLLLALGLTGWSFYAGGTPAETLTAAELAADSMGQVAVLVIDAVLLVLVMLAWQGSTPLWRRRIPAGAVYGITLVLAVLVLLTTSGKFRDWAIARSVPAPPVITREQVFDTAKAGYERNFSNFAGEPQPNSYFEGDWRRQGKIYRSDLRRLEVRRNGEKMQVRIWHECNPGGSPCEVGEVTAQVARSTDGLIASLAAEVEIPEGRLWMRMARGRKPDDSAVIMTQVYLRERPEWQVSSGGAVALWREQSPVPVADFLGDWSRSFPGEIGDFTRLSLRETAPGSHAMRAWARCEDKRECDLGESPLQVEAEAGLVRSVRSKFSSKGRELLVSLEPPRQGGRSFAVTENSAITYETVVVKTRRGPDRNVVRERGRSTATRRIALHRGHPSEPFSAMIAAGPLGLTPVAEGAPIKEGCAGIDDLHLAVVRDCIGRLGSLKAGLEQRNRQGQTPLALAVLENKPAMVKGLLAQGADINAPILFGEGEWPVSSGLQRAERPELAAGSTPLIMARDAAIVSLLLQAGAEKDVKNSYGWSAVFYYTHHGSVEMLESLLAAGADINATADADRSHRGTTALMWAAYMNRTAHLQTLLKYLPKRDMRDAAGKTALDYAKGFGHTESVRLLSAPAP